MPPPKVLLYPPHDRGNTRKREKNADFATLLGNLRQFVTLFGTLWCLFEKMQGISPRMLQGEMNSHLGYENNDHGAKSTDNRRNGYTTKR